MKPSRKVRPSKVKVSVPTSGSPTEMNTRAYTSSSTDAFRMRAQKGRRGRKVNPFDRVFNRN